MKRKSKRATAAASAPGPISRTGTPDLQRNLAVMAVLALGTLAAFSNSFSTGFALDNQVLLLGDARIQVANAANAGLILVHTYWWPHGESGLYRPLTTFSYLFNYAILGNGDRPGGYRWVNFLLHAANVLLLFALVLRLNGRVWTAALIAMVWAVHPLLTESVTNIVGRADLLAGFAVLGGFLCYLKSMEAEGWRRGAWLGALAVVTAAGAFSKESAVVLPAVIVLYEIACEKRWRRMAAGLIATAMPVGIMLAQRAAVFSASLPAEYPFLDNPIMGAGFWVGRLTALKVLGRYLGLAVWPWKLSSDYSYSQIGLAHGGAEDWICWIAVVGTAALAAVLWNRSRLAFFFLGFAFLNLLPASNLLFPIGTIMAERLMYLPLAGLVAAAAIAVAALPVSGRALAMCGVAIAVAFAVRTWVRNIDWTDDKTMAMATVRTSPKSFKAHRLLAAQLLGNDAAQSDVDGAIAEIGRSLAILETVPDEMQLAEPWNLAAVCHRVKGDRLKGDDARKEYEEAARLAQRSIAVDKATRAAYDRRHGAHLPAPATAADAYRTLASAYLHLNRPREALGAAVEAQRIDPSNSGAYQEMAEADLDLERAEEAAIVLAEGMFASDSRDLLSDLMRLYQSGLDEKKCAVVTGPRGPTLNPNCEIVRRNMCEATGRLHREDLRRRMGCTK